MKKHEIKVGGHYTAKVNGRLVTVRVDSIKEGPRGISKNTYTSYGVTNLTTGRTTSFRSAMKFKGEVKAEVKVLPEGTPFPKELVYGFKEGEQSLPPINLEVPAASTAASPAARTSPSTTPTSVTPATTVAATRHTGGLAERLARTTDDSPHLIVEARAGTGKTTTLIEGLKRLKGQPTPGFVPSPQQQAVFDCIELSRGKVSSICFVAFNKSIAAELKSRVPAGCEASTMHGMGFKAVTRAIRLNNSNAVNQDRTQKIVEEITGKDVWELRRTSSALLGAVTKLVSLCKMNLVSANEDIGDGIEPWMGWEEQLSALASHYDVELDGVRDQVFDLVPQVLARCLDVQKDGFIDFDDMIWLPVVLDLPMTKYDLLLVDEAQDLNRCQQALAKKAGRRLILCGDPKQAIYGFAGADADSMPRMAKELEGCVTLPLTVTRRCGKAIVAEAKRIVPDFDAFETNGEGLISEARYPTEKSGRERDGVNYTTSVQDGDMVLCRVNAPLVSQCFRFLKMGRRANIQGRDIGQGLISLVKKLGKDDQDVPKLVAKISEWGDKETAKENAKKFPSDARLIAISDRVSCLHCFTEDAKSVSDVVRKIEQIFTDDKGRPGILLSSIHRAKGLEASHVFFLMPEGAECPHPMAKSAWQVEQEWNLRYVAVTRAIKELTYVS